MRAEIVVANQEIESLTATLRLLTSAGHGAAGFSDPMKALNWLRASPAVDLLVTGSEFGGKRPHGISLALMARYRFPNIKVLFIVDSELKGHATDLGEVVPATIRDQELLSVVERVLTAGAPRR